MYRTTILISFMLSACTLYKSSGREIIEENKSNIVGSYSVGVFSLEGEIHSNGNNSLLSYQCFESIQSPEFLKEPLVVLDSPFEKMNFSTLLKEPIVNRDPAVVFTYRFNDIRSRHDYCQFQSLSHNKLTETEIREAARIGVKMILTKDKQTHEAHIYE